MKPLTVGSLFAGIGGFDLGFERAGMKVVWQVEIDSYCQKVLARHFPDAERFGDIRECGKHNLKAVDVVCGGFPCQDISNAGACAGIEGERSGLWGDMHRIIGELRPRYVVVENVAALLGRGMDRVIGDLAASGYDAEWRVIRASDVGAPHRRERVWILAYAEQDGCGGQLSGSEAANADVSGRTFRVLQGWTEGAIQLGNGGRSIRDSAGERLPNWAGGEMGQPSPLTQLERPDGREVELSFCGVAHGVSKRVDRLRGLGNAIVPQIAEWIGRRIVAVAAPKQVSLISE